MKKSFAVALILSLTLWLASGVPGWAAAQQPIPIVLGEKAHSAERLAAGELADALQKLYPAEKFEIKTYESGFVPQSGKMILLGTPQSLPQKGGNDAMDRVSGKPESYFVDSFTVNTAQGGPYQVGLIAGADPRGVVYGVYALLEKLGCGFYFSYDAIPSPKKEALSFKNWTLEDAPLAGDRVVFDWHNFLSGCSTWSLEHWEKWIVQSQKMGYNAVMVHAYGNNPMVEFEYGGQTKPVGYLSTTRSGRDWSTQHVNDVRRLWGGQVFDGPVFGSAAAMDPGERRVEAAQKMMHDAFECARQRAMGVFFAFDMETFQANPQNLILTLPESARFLVPSNSGPDKLWLADPDTPAGFDYYKGQVAALLKNYPQITTLVCWFRWGAGTPWMRMALENMPPAWQAEYRAEIAKTPEAAKLELPEGCFALSKAVRAYARALKELGRSDIRVATGTWRFLFYPACDRFMPEGVIFMGLDYDVLRGHSAFAEPEQRAQQAAVGAHRPIIPVAWAHHDDGNYLGRSYTPYADFANDLAEMKAAGYGIIHWTTRPLDLYFKSLIEQVWSETKNRPLAVTCREMAERTFGAAAREAGGEYLYQWVTTAPLFTRETSENFVDRKLDDPTTVSAACRARLEILDRIDAGALTKPGAERVAYYRGLEQFIMDVHRNEAAYRKSIELLSAGDRAGARAALEGSDPAAAIERYAKFSSLGGMSRGEQGTVVSMNTRWLPHYVSLRQALGQEAVRFNFGPTQHDPLAQSMGKYTFYFDAKHNVWETYGTEETGVETFTTDKGDEEICRGGIASDKPLTLSLRPIIQRSGRGAAATLPAGDYRLELWTIDPDSSAAGQRVFEVRVAPHESEPRAGGMDVVAFEPVKAKYLRLACRGNNENEWNSIVEVALDTLDRKDKVTASRAGKGYPAEAAADGEAKTRWAIQGRDEWIQFPLDAARETSQIGIKWYGGERRKTQFEVLVSDDGQTWRKVSSRPAGKERAGQATQTATVTEPIDIYKTLGGVGLVLHKEYEIKLGKPGSIDLTLTPIQGKAVLSAVALTPR